LRQFTLLLRLYLSPLRTFSQILDEGKVIFALAAALVAMLALQVPRTADYNRSQAKLRAQAVRAKVERMQAQLRAKARATSLANTQAAAETKPGANADPKASSTAPTNDAADSDDDDDALADLMTPPSTEAPSALEAMDRFTARAPTQYFSPLLALAICFVPTVILIVTLENHLGGFSTILFRDYMALLVCCLLAWAAPYLLLAAANQGLRASHVPAYDHPALWWAAQAYFMLLAICAIRTLFGTTFIRAAGAGGGAWAASVGGLFLYSMFGNVTAYLASPFVLYYLYAGLSPEFRGLGTGLRSRQRLKRQLENATLNPRDADAHYQLGLIYMQRRQYEPAIDRFNQAIAVDPNEADAHYQLGRIAREQGRHEDALVYFEACAKIDDKHSSSDVWREIGITQLMAERGEEARVALEKYLARRPYDPEGNCWYGRAMARLGHNREARAAFEQAIEAVRTMPSARKRQVSEWESEARRDLRKLPAA
jgi:tetratricopeptide (TPR) repeat protein